MKTKQLFKTHLFSLAVLFSMALAAVSCANEDIAQNGKTGENGKGFATFVADAPTQTRTSIDYATGNFYWEEGDKIYVKDDDGTIQVSNSVDAAHAHSSSFRFRVPGKFKNSPTYKVYYLGKDGSNNQVTIPTAQTQTTPNSTKHLGDSGDYGTATATGTLGGSIFSFELEHQATYLVFQPYTSNAVLKNCYLTKIEVNADDDIAETYTIDPSTGNLNSSVGAKQITIETKDPVVGSANENGFPLTNNAPSVTTNGAYMLIKPGVHTLKVRYWVKDYVTNVEGTITKTLSSFNYAKNTYYDMTANLNAKDYDAYHYYMWDAQNNFWSGHEWDTATPWQPTLEDDNNPNFPKKGDTLGRYYNNSFPGYGVSNPATTTLFKSLPNINEMSWYCMYGDPRWDGDGVWTTMGHLYKSGMWIKKKSVLKAGGHYNTEYSADGITDLRINFKNYENTSLTPGLPSASEIGDYFFLPSLGYYHNGSTTFLGSGGGYWSSTGDPRDKDSAYCLIFGDVSMSTKGGYLRSLGYRVQVFE
jgi:putative lipoprotein